MMKWHLEVALSVESVSNFWRDGSRSTAFDVQALIANHFVLLSWRHVGSERQLKAFYEDGEVSDKGDERKWTVDEASLAKLVGHIRTKGLFLSWENDRGTLYCCLSGVRCIGGVTLSQALRRNVRSRHQMPSENTKPWHAEVESSDAGVLWRTAL